MNPVRISKKEFLKLKVFLKDSNGMKMFLAIMVVFLAVFVFAVSAQAAERFVAVCANNGDGSSAICASTPGGAGAFNTIQAGVNALVAGDTLTVLDGTYKTGGTLSARVEVTTAGTSDKPVIIRSQNKHGAKVDASAKSFAFFIRGNASYITVDGFDLYNARNGIFIRTGIDQGQGGGGYFEIINNRIHNNGNSGDCTLPAYGLDGIFEDSHHVLIKGNIVYKNGRLHCRFPGQALHHDHGMYMTGWNYVIQENIIYGNAGFGVKVTMYTGAPGGAYTPQPSPYGANLIIRNNVLYDEEYDSGILLWCITSSGSTCSGNQYGIIENNIMYKNTGPNGYPIYFWTGKSSNVNYTIRNNIFYGNTGNNIYTYVGDGSTVTGLHESNTIRSDPLFFDEANLDFHLQPSSPGKSAGFGGVDIGAYPHGNGSFDTTPPAPPTGLVVQ